MTAFHLRCTNLDTELEKHALMKYVGSKAEFQGPCRSGFGWESYISAGSIVLRGKSRLLNNWSLLKALYETES